MVYQKTLALSRRELIRCDNIVSQGPSTCPHREVVKINEKISEHGLPLSRIKAPHLERPGDVLFGIGPAYSPEETPTLGMSKC